MKGQLAAKKGKLGPKHPDVIKLSRQVRMLSKEVDELLTEKSMTEVSEEKPDNAALYKPNDPDYCCEHPNRRPFEGKEKD